MSKGDIIYWIVMIVLWSAAGIINLITWDISRLTYGVTWGIGTYLMVAILINGLIERKNKNAN